MDVLLVYPNSDTHYVVPPIGLGYLASALRKSGISASILDGIKEKLDIAKLIDCIGTMKPKIVGIQVFSCDVLTVQKYAQAIKSFDRSIVVVIGGAHVSGTGKQVFDDFTDIDYAIAGEGEKGFPTLVKRIISRVRRYEDIPGLIWRDNDAVNANTPYFEHNLDNIEFPSWDMMNPGTYPKIPQGAFFRNYPIAPVLTSRGCPFRCTYCAGYLTTGRMIRLRSIDNIMKEIEILYHTYGVREFHIIDDNFTIVRSRVIEFCSEIEKRNLKISIAFPNGVRLDTLDKELLEIMKKAGCFSMALGIESGTQKILDDMNKALDINIIEEKVKLIDSMGIFTTGFFIIGYPTETEETILETIKFAKKLHLKRAHFSTFLPLPGTDATNELIKSGVIDKIDYSRLFYSKAPMPPKGMTSDELKKLQRKAFMSFYCRPKILFSLLSEVKSFTHLKALAKRAIDYAG